MSSIYLSSVLDEVQLKEALTQRGIEVASRFDDASFFVACCRGSEWNEKEWGSAVEYLQSHPGTLRLVAAQLSAAPLAPSLSSAQVIALFPHWKAGVNELAALVVSSGSSQDSHYVVESDGIYARRATFGSDGTRGHYTVRSKGPMVIDEQLDCVLGQTVRIPNGGEK